MNAYLMIGSRDPFESKDVTQLYALAAELSREGNKVTLFLVQDGVFAARDSACSAALAAVAANGVEILADEFSLIERGISPARVADGVSPVPLDTVVDQLADGRKTIWN